MLIISKFQHICGNKLEVLHFLSNPNILALIETMEIFEIQTIIVHLLKKKIRRYL